MRRQCCDSSDGEYHLPTCINYLLARDDFLPIVGETLNCSMCGAMNLDPSAIHHCPTKVPKHHDPVNHPQHYTSHPSGVECIQIIEHLPFCIGAAIKYLWRCGLKGDEIEDLKKAAWYVNREIARREKAVK